MDLLQYNYYQNDAPQFLATIENYRTLHEMYMWVRNNKQKIAVGNL